MRDSYDDGRGPRRKQVRCPFCKQPSGVFFARMTDSEAVFHCVSRPGRKRVCGAYFVGVAPKPLKAEGA